MESEEDCPGPYVGSWINLYADFQPGLGAEKVELLPDGTCTVDGEDAGNWSVSEDGSTVVIGNWIWGFTPIKDEGAIKLLDNYTKKENELTITSAVLVREEDRDRIWNSMFEKIEVNENTIAEYVGEQAEIAVEHDEDGKTARIFYQFLSPAYERGLVFVSASDDFSFSAEIEPKNLWLKTMTFDYPYAVFSEDREMTFCNFTNAEGSILYISKEYVADNRIDEKGCRILTIKDGSRIADWLTEGTWLSCPADYADSRY